MFPKLMGQCYNPVNHNDIVVNLSDMKYLFIYYNPPSDTFSSMSTFQNMDSTFMPETRHLDLGRYI